MKQGITILFLFLSVQLFAPPNCEIYKQDPDCYESCKAAMTAIRYKQGSSRSQYHFDRSIELCPAFAYSYMEKAVPFLKRGLFVEWKNLIDQAVQLAPEEYLGYRGWCRLQFLRDYDGAISDIEKLQSLVPYDIGYCQTGDYHLNIALALCYKMKGQLEKAKEIFIEQLNSKNYSVGLYDYYHLGILEYELGNYELAREALVRQIELNDYLGETYYFLAMVSKAENKRGEYLQNLEVAENYYRKGNHRTDTYTETLDKVYLMDIMEARGAAPEMN